MGDQGDGASSDGGAEPGPTQVDSAVGLVIDALTELHRLDLEVWGDTRTAQVFRCVAAANYRDGRAAKLSAIASSLDLGLATVHQRLKTLEAWRDTEAEQPVVLVERVADGFRLTRDGENRLQRWLEIAQTRAIPQIATCAGKSRSA